jgi:hypothetical protein
MRSTRPPLLVLAAGATFAAVCAVPGGCSKEEEPERPTSRKSTQGTYDTGLDRPPEGAGSASGPAGEKLTPPAFRFEDVSAESGVTAVNHSGLKGEKEYLVEAVGVGPAWFDYDRDGRMDLYLPDGDVFSNYVLDKVVDPTKPDSLRTVLKAKDPRPQRFRDHLYRNLGGGKFEEVAVAAGVADERWSFGALAWDYDGDGWTDLFVANLGKNRLYRNNGNGTFTDVAEAAGLAGDENEWSTCASCGDYDGDGRLDLYVARYANVAAEIERQRVSRKLPWGEPVENIRGRSCKWRDVDVYCGPVGLEAQPDTLYRQQEDGTFRDVSQEVGIRAKPAKYGFTSFFFDYDSDGLLDIYVANDSEENMLWHQDRTADGRPIFRDVADLLGVKYGPSQQPQASMGVSLADFDRNGLFDIFITNFSHDYNNIYVAQRFGSGSVTFHDKGLQVMGAAVFYDLSWGCGWYDFDQDRDLDLFVANGHVYAEVDRFKKTGTSYDQYPAVFECLDAPSLRYREVGAKLKDKPPKGSSYADVFAGKGLEIKRCCRGAAFGDYDDDGDVDVVVQAMNDVPIVLRNELAASPGRRWIKLVPRQDGPNRDAVGGTVTVEVAGGPTQHFPIYRCQSFLGTDDPRIHVGLGASETATVTVTWPGREREKSTYPDLAAGAVYVLQKGGSAERAGPR